MIFFRDMPPAPFKVGDQVRILDGPFASFNGVVQEIDDLHSRMKVAVSIFGPPKPIEIGFGQAEKL
jgi:transcription termination/antitermination protein NusG